MVDTTIVDADILYSEILYADMVGAQMIGKRYRVVAQNTDVVTMHKIFYGTCDKIIPTWKSFVKCKFVDITDQYHEPTQNDKWLLINLNDSLYSNGWIFMKLMEPELSREIQRYNEIRSYNVPSLANLCRMQISYKTRIEMQGTYIDDVINVYTM